MCVIFQGPLQMQGRLPKYLLLKQEVQHHKMPKKGKRMSQW